ncbi:hypothetical protein AAG570_010565 [Ranatra chinensis]|uniref:START domain-containing protein n=1 Tax=Ranatra chinensis TaxID=642074 RepID=A0ABD0Z503_9HEMI
MGGGIIKGRDFVLLRHWEEKYDHTIIANISVSCPWAPHNKKCIRGENGPGCWAIRNCAQDGKCELTWLLNTDIKGWLPEQVVYTSSVNVMLNYISLLRKHLAQLNV